MLIISTQLLLLFTNIVVSSALEDNLSQHNGVTSSYRYNHPPLYDAFGYSEPEKIEIRKERDVEPNQNKEGSVNQDGTIPVAVAYDAEPVKLRSNNQPQANSTAKGRRRKLRKHRNQNPALKEKVTEIKETLTTIANKVSVTEAPSKTLPTSKTIVPKVFTKRPPEDNPPVKNIRARDPVVKILENSNFVYAHSGNFHYSFEGADGTKVSSVGELKSFDDNKTGESVAGNVSYKDNEGNDFSFSYTADENGYVPHGAHLPTPPPIPPAIARALKYLATKTTPEPVTERTKRSKE